MSIWGENARIDEMNELLFRKNFPIQTLGEQVRRELNRSMTTIIPLLEIHDKGKMIQRGKELHVIEEMKKMAIQLDAFFVVIGLVDPWLRLILGERKK